MTVTLSPTILSPANNQMVTVTATITAADNADVTATITLVSITSNQKNGNRVDVEGAAFGTDDRAFSLRADPAGKDDGVYSVTYRATDHAGNFIEMAKEVIVRK